MRGSFLERNTIGQPLSTPPQPTPTSRHSLFAFFSCAAILLPAHPSFQSVFLTYDVPSHVVAAGLALPLLYIFIVQGLLTPRLKWIFLLFLPYVCWMLVRAMFSPAFGEPNFLASLRGTVILAPFALICALIASRDPVSTARIIVTFGLIAVAHFLVLILTGDSLNETVGFRTLSADPERSNYQSTSFYIGLTGVYLACVALRNRGLRALFAFLGTIIVVVLMGLVGARATIVALAACIFAIFIVSRFSYIIRVLVLATTAFAIVAATVWMLGFFVVEEFLKQLIVIERLAVLFDDDDSSQRVRLFSSALAMWLDSPTNFLVGGGLGTFPDFIGAPAKEGWYPHNFILESLAEGGLVAGILLLPGAILLLTKFVKLKSNTTEVERIYLGVLAIYVVVTYQFIGGLQTLWIPTFFVSLFLFTSSTRRS